MIKRPSTCGAYAIRPYPTGRRGRAQKQKRSPKEWTDIAPFIITSNHYGNSVVNMYREVGAYGIRSIERKGRMIKRPSTCGAYAIRLYPTGRRGRAQKQKIPPKEWTDIAPFTDLCGH